MKHLMLYEAFMLRNLEDRYGIALDLWDRGSYLELDRIVVPADKRGTGIGSQVMQHIVDYADRTGKDIRLTPDTSFGGTSVARLTRFYKGFGFQKNKDYEHRASMVRYADK